VTQRKQGPGATRTELTGAEVEKLVLERIREMTLAEWLALSVAAGVHNPDGTLTPEYGGDDDHAAVADDELAADIADELANAMVAGERGIALGWYWPSGRQVALRVSGEAGRIHLSDGGATRCELVFAYGFDQFDASRVVDAVAKAVGWHFSGVMLGMRWQGPSEQAAEAVRQYVAAVGYLAVAYRKRRR